jgi:lycopene cyclase domain-containing protein
MPEYALILLLFLLVSVVLQRHGRLKIYRSTKQLVITNICFLIIGVAWDHVAIGRGHWYFGQRYLLGPRIGLMPIEEYGFTFILPYFVLVLYRFIEKNFAR